ncbi:MAG: major capsid protein [Microviridae sp.]|nr:MAG: major capsid protein [Microviridae sp.]
MPLPMHKNKSVGTHSFAMIPKADIPRSTFLQKSTHKTTGDAGYLIPIYLNEVYPGDTYNLHGTIFARLATPLFPIMDNLWLDIQYWFVPYRLVWTNWAKFMGEQANPADSISYTIPIVPTKASGYDINSLQDYMGLPTLGQMTAAATINHSTLPLRAYNLIWNNWYRDENLQNSVVVDLDDGPDVYTDYNLLRRGKRPDYITSCLPWAQKGTSVTLPIGTTAPISGIGITTGAATAQARSAWGVTSTNDWTSQPTWVGTDGIEILAQSNAVPGTSNRPQIFADLSQATGATINAFRNAVAVQTLLEKDARGGTRLTEIIRQQFGVVSPDARLQRPEYLGGSSAPINVNPIAQTSGTSASGTTTPLGNLAAAGAGVNKSGFTQSFTEHGVVMGLMSIRADLSYQQGLERWWSESTRCDKYTPVFANLGEQAVLLQELYVKGNGASGDTTVWGYQERWSHLRYKQSIITGLFRSTAASTIDPWHLAQKFTSAPTLNTTFIQDTPPVSRIVAVGAAANGQQFIIDSFWQNKLARQMPTYSIPQLQIRF